MGASLRPDGKGREVSDGLNHVIWNALAPVEIARPKLPGLDEQPGESHRLASEYVGYDVVPHDGYSPSRYPQRLAAGLEECLCGLAADCGPDTRRLLYGPDVCAPVEPQSFGGLPVQAPVHRDQGHACSHHLEGPVHLLVAELRACAAQDDDLSAFLRQFGAP